MRRRPGLLAAAALATLFAALFAAFPATAADLYGKPLRGLSPVSVAAVVREPARYSQKPVRVEGPNAGAAGRPALKEGNAVLPVVSDGSFELPQDFVGGFLAAEGRARAGETGAVFVATGVEVRRENRSR
ncbi:MAG TPA: hypothetical protein VLJ18_01840 [Thermoanaerobaculia bacterium]|nr:hypothetical protein [Thermoanaerobaculia bacterium]